MRNMFIFLIFGYQKWCSLGKGLNRISFKKSCSISVLRKSSRNVCMYLQIMYGYRKYLE